MSIFPLNRRRHFLCLLGLLVAVSAMAQPVAPSLNIPETPSVVTPPAVTYPGLANISGLIRYNFVRTEVPDIPLQTLVPPASAAVIYQHNFNAGPYTHPYTATPTVLNPQLSNSYWTNTGGTWTSYSGVGGDKALALTNAGPATKTLTLSFSVGIGYIANINSFSFYHRSSSTGYSRWKMVINNTPVDSGNIFVDVLNGSNPMHATGNIQLNTPISELRGDVKVDLILGMGSGGSTATFRIDNFTLNGSVTPDRYVRCVTNYFDGLGRPLQTVARKAQAEGNDVVNHYVYDASGRETYKYLSFNQTVAASLGNFVPEIEATMRQLFDPAYPGEQPYGKTEYDNSPLNRVVKELAPGASWIGSNRGVGHSYSTNKDLVYAFGSLFYQVTGAFPRYTIGTGSQDLPQYAGNYPESTLYIHTVKDEDGNTNDEVKDKKGRLLMKRRVYQKVTGVSPLVPAEAIPDNLAYTIYVYDDQDRLRAVLPPELLKPVGTTSQVTVPGGATTTTYAYTWSALTAEQMNNLAYRYFYDERDRALQKKLPGKEAEYYVYDKRDRQVLYQDGNLRAQQGKWLFTAYDALDRIAFTGTYAPAGVVGQASLQNMMNDGNTYPAGSLLFYLKNPALWHSYPASLSDGNLLSYTYYDDYSQLGSFSYDASAFSAITINPSTQPFLEAPAPANSKAVEGLVTGTKMRILDPDNPAANNWISSVNYYDSKGRLVQTQSGNIKGGTDISSNVYYFQGMLWKTVLKHQNPAALALPGSTAPLNTLQVITTTERNLTSGGGNDRVGVVTHKIGTGNEYPFASYRYDHAARLTGKTFPAASSTQRYNVRGLLTDIEMSRTDPAQEADWFEEHLYYDKGFGSKLYSGNIAGITWKKAGSAAAREAYGYSYDMLSRLNHAEYRRQEQGASGWLKDEYDYSASNITYDKSGNLQTMNQRGVNPAVSSTPIDMDQLSYTYAANSNQLVKVKDMVSPDNTVSLPDFKDSADLGIEYTYDANGNLITDENKHITAITYNYLNKPEKITVGNQGSITYVYDAAGNRLQKKVTYTGAAPQEVYDYIGNFTYKDNVLQYMLNEEGRTRPVVNAGAVDFVYDYFAKDHLGNVRSVATMNPISPGYLATHEIARAAIEEQVFEHIPEVRSNKPLSVDPQDQKAALTKGDGNRIGTAIMLRTMPGDKFLMFTNAYYDGGYVQSSSVPGADMVASLMGALLGGQTYPGVPLSELPENARIVKTALENPALATQIDNLLDANNDPNAPKAHLNYLFFNEKMELVPALSKSIQVSSASNGIWQEISACVNCPADIVGPFPAGYIMVYIDNQSPGKEVWFDDLYVGHFTSSILEENHYYPFGLTLQNSQPANATPNRYKFQTKELERSFGLETYEYGARQYDPQIGRWKGIDPLANKYYNVSPMAYCANNPVILIDPNGAELVLTGSQADITSTVTRIQNSVGSSYTVEPNANGSIVMTPNASFKGTVSAKEQAAIDTYKPILSLETGKATVGVVNESDEVNVGGFDEQQVDVADINLYDNIENTSGEPTVYSGNGKLMHELAEQYKKQVEKAEKLDAHNAGITAENSYNGSKRPAAKLRNGEVTDPNTDLVKAGKNKETHRQNVTSSNGVVVTVGATSKITNKKEAEKTGQPLREHLQKVVQTVQQDKEE